MIDIIELNDGEDLGLTDTVVMKASNLCSVQLGSLEYAQSFGVDLNFFLSSEFQIQVESFRSYLVQRIVENQINVTEVITTINTFSHKYTYFVGDKGTNEEGLLI